MRDSSRDAQVSVPNLTVLFAVVFGGGRSESLIEGLLFERPPRFMDVTA